MRRLFTKDELISFEKDLARVFEQGLIYAPVHFSGGNEEELIRLFESIDESDWVFSTHRSHYHALLKGVDKDFLRNEILEGRSICLHDKEHNFFTSAIVAGAVSIAVGVAFGISLRKESQHVWVFVGDMAAETGVFHESVKYARRNNLPVTFIIEDNDLSVNTSTSLCWGKCGGVDSIKRYYYERQYPHQGIGKWIDF